MEQLMEECEAELSKLCAMNEYMTGDDDGERPFVCRASSIENEKEGPLELIDECIHLATELYDKIQKRVEDAEQEEVFDTQSLGDQMQKFALELHDTMSSLPEDLQEGLNADIANMNLENKVKGQTALTTSRKKKVLVRRPKAKNKEQRCSVVMLEAPIPVYRKELNPLVRSYVDHKKRKKLLEGTQHRDRQSKESESDQNALLWTCFRSKSIEKHISRQQNARDRKQKPEHLDAEERFKPAEKKPTFIKKTSITSPVTSTTTPQGYLGRYKKKIQAHSESDPCEELVQPHNIISLPDGDDHNSKHDYPEWTRVSCYLSSNRSQVQVFEIDSIRNLRLKVMDKFQIRRADSFRMMKHTSAIDRKSGKFVPSREIQSDADLRTGDLLRIEPTSSSDRGIKGPMRDSKAQARLLKDLRSPLEKVQRMTWDDHGRRLLLLPPKILGDT